MTKIAKEGMSTAIESVVKTAEQNMEYEKLGVTPESFAKEMHFQVYRIENVLQGFDVEKLKVLKENENTKALLKDPQLATFLGSLNDKKSEKFIDDAKNKSVAEREKLLEGVRKLIFRASLEAKKTEGANREMVEEEAEVKKTFEAKLEDSDITNIENNLATPFELKDPKMIGLNKLQNYYTSVMNGQRVFEHYVNSMQVQYKSAISKYEAYNKRHSKRDVAGIFYWIGRKIKPGKKGSTKVNEAIAPARNRFNEDFNKFKTVKSRIDERSKEIKDGLLLYKKSVRAELKDRISKSEWTKAREEEALGLQEKRKDKKAELSTYLLDLGKKDDEISLAKQDKSKLSDALRERYEKIEYGADGFETRKTAVEARIKQLEKVYGADSEQVKNAKSKILQPVLEGKAKVLLLKLNVGEKLTDAEQDNQKLDLLQADIFMEKTGVMGQIEGLTSEIDKKQQEIGRIIDIRKNLEQILENMEVSYMAVDEFKSSVDSNLDKVLDGNSKVSDDITLQNEAFKNLKVTEPGFFTSLWNTGVIGKWGALGGLKVITNDAPKYIVNKITFGKISNWGLGTLTGKLYEGAEWLYNKSNNGFKNTSGFLSIFPGTAAVLTGVLKSAAGLVNGVGMLASSPDKVFKGLDSLTLKTLGKSLIHLDEWKKNPLGALGESIGDVVAIFFTAGSGKAASAAGVATQAGKSAAWAGAKAFALEIARKTVTLPANLFHFAKDIVLAFRGAGQGVWGATGLFLDKLKNNISSQMNAPSAKAGEKAAVLATEGARKIGPELQSVVDDTLKGLTGKTKAEIMDMAKTVKDQIPKVQGFVATNAAEELLRHLKRYANSSGRLSKIETKLTITADQAFTIVEQGGKNLTIENIKNAKRAVRNKIDDLVAQERQFEFYKNNGQANAKRLKQLNDEIKNIDDMVTDLRTTPQSQLAAKLQGKSLTGRLKELRGAKGVVHNEIKILKDTKLIDNEIARIASEKAGYITKEAKIGYIKGEYSFVNGLKSGRIYGAYSSIKSHFQNYKGQILKSGGRDALAFTKVAVYKSELFLLKKYLMFAAIKNPILSMKIYDLIQEFDKLEGLYEKKMKLEEERLKLSQSKDFHEREKAGNIQSEIDELDAQMNKIGELIEDLPGKVEIDPKYMKEVEEMAQKELTNLIQNKSQIKPITK
ncbi:hypothetical protein C0416_01275 [bacterium]|nr:hypothetical protein [bacterium]